MSSVKRMAEEMGLFDNDHNMLGHRDADDEKETSSEAFRIDPDELIRQLIFSQLYTLAPEPPMLQKFDQAD